jgi:hypothetical protein
MLKRIYELVPFSNIIGKVKPEMTYILGIPVYFLAILSIIPVIYFALVWPKKLIEARSYTPGVRRFLRWANCLSWLCLSLALFAWGAGNVPMALLLVVVGSVIYLMFVVLLTGNVRRPGKRT